MKNHAFRKIGVMAAAAAIALTSINGLPLLDINGWLSINANAEGGIAINATNFPDANFRDYIISEHDQNNDGILSKSEIKAIDIIEVPGYGISSLKGMEYFTALVILKCNNNQLTSLDVSNNAVLEYLDCSENCLTKLDISGCTALDYLYCDNNQLTSLDVSKNTALADLSCGYNQLTILDISKNASLESLSCSDNQLTSLDISKNVSLESLGCSDNQLTSLDVTKNTALIVVDCNNNQLTTLDISGCNSLISLNCNNNQLTNLDISGCTALGNLNCENNQLTSLDVSKNTTLTSLLCGKNKITSLDVSDCSALIFLWCNENLLTSLEVSKNAELIDLVCDDNQLTSLNVSACAALEYILCSDNKLTNIDVSKNAALWHLSCAKNQLTSLDISKNPEIMRLDCDDNLLTSLDISNNTLLEFLYCDKNKLTSLDVSENTELVELFFSKNQITNIDVSNNTLLITLSCDNNQLTNLDVSKNTELNVLGLSNNLLTNLDVSNNPALEILYCDYNRLTSLDVSKNTALVNLSCFDNQLTSLDVSNNAALVDLSCKNNQLTSLNVSGCSALESLYCKNNQLTSLDVSGNPSLMNLSIHTNSYVILVDGNSYSLDNLTKFGFNPEKASDWCGADYNSETNTLENITETEITYIYDCGNSYSAYFTLVVKELTPTVESVAASVENGNVIISWDAVENATSYRVYRADTIDGEKTLLKTIGILNYTDTTAVAGKTYYYFVAAYNSNTGVLSDYSEGVSVTLPEASIAAPTLPEKPFFCLNDIITVKWNEVEGATSYRVYRATSPTGAKTQLKTTGLLRYTDQPKSGTYYYFIAAYNSKTGLLSDYSAPIKVSLITKPVISKAEYSNGTVALEWNYVNTATSYRVFRTDKETGVKTQIKTVGINRCTDTNVQAGKTYIYTVQAWNNNLRIISASANPKTVTVSALAAPEITSASYAGGSVSLAWTSVDGATSYRVYRADSATGEKTLLKSTGILRFTDTTAKAGKTYYYFVAAYNSKTGTMSSYSAAEILNT